MIQSIHAARIFISHGYASDDLVVRLICSVQWNRTGAHDILRVRARDTPVLTDDKHCKSQVSLLA